MDENGSMDRFLCPYRVLDLADEKGLLCGKLLGDLGADVIKIEKPGGDPARMLGPFFCNEPHPEKSLFWFALNTSKRGITLNIETSSGQQILKQLVRQADFLIESFPPGYLDQIGLGYSVLETINPKIIMVSITPFGQTGPRKDWKTSDIVAWAMGGQMAPCGDIDRPPFHISYHSQSYLLAGLDSAQGALTALFYRWSTGVGQQVDVSIQESVLQSTEHITSAWDRRHTIQKRGDETGFRQSQLWRCKDGYVSFAYSGAASGSSFDASLLDWLESENMLVGSISEYKMKPLAPVGREVPTAIKEATARLFMAHTKAELLYEALRREIQLYPVSTPSDILANPQLAARGFWQDIEHPELGTTISYPGAFVLGSACSPGISRRAPLIGEHNNEIYQQALGMSPEELLSLQQAGII